MTPDRNGQEMPTPAERAGEWCVRLSTGSLSSDEQASFDNWIADDPLNRAAFDQALTVWQGLHAIGDSPELISRRADALEALRRANRRRWSRHFTSRQWLGAIAACLALVLVSTLWLLGNRPELYGTGVGERRVVLLEDGSRLSLDAETRVSALYSRNQRSLVLLSGRAKFDVAKDFARPFTVTAGDRTVIATGTAFSVELLDHKVHVIVYEGSVAVLAGGPPPADQLLKIKQHPEGSAIPLSTGKELDAGTSSAAPPAIINADVSRSLAWEAGQLNFVDEPMGSAVERLNRYSREKIVIGDSRVASIRINGVFNAGDSAAFADAVSQAYPVEVERDGSDFVLASSSSTSARKKVM